MGIVMWRSDTKPLLGVLRGEVTLTWQKHRTEIDLKGSSYPVTSGQALLFLPEEPKMDTSLLSLISARVLVPK